ncbi:FKBP-type peptidyl-prolyl cis-trans isomerase [Reinekea marinisedimentorum]|uniref:Peptidyl-prolyl cis-trans isomerase n=1 Tax=Reinekea marinisedimentorum TaxID=230495 RepID=A0A4R3I581_9GAMM|nr:FKBP-type peptidyl-prolyl cis-trans isomerase [Reinekea marinisedimentorum]TCS40801.1 FKBP-type peptidyl-prolyl cis-trans isomerase FklB [Reinekea marinisedimentorum]
MKFVNIKGLAVTATLAMAISGCAQAVSSTEPASLDTDEQKASYGIGYGFASNLKAQTEGIELSSEALVQGVLDAFEENDMAVTEADVQAAITALQQKQIEIQAAEAEAQSQVAREAGEAFLAENAKKEGVTTTESGLQYEVLESSGSDEHPTAESTVSVHYHGTLVNGTVFDSSVERGEPIDFPLANVIQGWTEGVQLMSVGDKYRFFIPADLAYGDNQVSPDIPPGSTLIFEVELLDIM